MKKVRPFYTSKDIAALLGVSVSTVYDYNKYSYLGFPKGFKIGDFWRWRPEDIDAWIDAQRGVQGEETQDEEFDTFTVNSEKLLRVLNHAVEMYELLCRVADPDDVCPNKEIRALLNAIDND